MMLRLLLLALLCGGVSGGSHSLRYFNMAVTPGSGVPEFVVVGYVDEEKIVYYDSVLGRTVPRQQWMAESQGPDYWERETQIFRGNEQVSKANIHTLMRQTNQTGGIHFLQRMYGCELRDDGTTTGFNRYGWDGSDFISFDKDRMVWVTPVPWGQITKDKWDRNTAMNQDLKGYLEQECIEWLTRYVRAGESHLQPSPKPNSIPIWIIAVVVVLVILVVVIAVGVAYKKRAACFSAGNKGYNPTKNPPEVYFTASEDNRLLSCVATGFYPQSIDVTILRNGRIVEETHSHGILPNHDNTYQLTRTVQVEPTDTAEFSCWVEHRGLPEPLVLILGSKPNSIPIWILAIFVVLVILVVVIAVGVAYKNKAACFSAGNKGYNPTKTSDKGESSSNSSATA
ncbi:class I histocompatibility antigen, F10 alpha chain-like isoform X1 [Hypanus sabinus]|uniref:class I histocompatibility antigen, F10 alpha chain-like isoform X1 n=1 Tax=Hypanus sabinus TaxID=79690 RepID=UPI0028C4AF2E|nr:class I histocompatibility antigen, F10 alpha chain-like isoform X1 [Hypanus sabinus]